MAYYFLSSFSFKIKPWKNNDNNNEQFQILLYQWLSQTPVPTNKNLVILLKLIPADFSKYYSALKWILIF